jgi:GT2 family glycosyltransferase
LISVIIPAKNADRYLGEQLDALARQTYSGSYEVIVADNGSSDGTHDLVVSYQSRLPVLRIVDAGDRPGASHARNRGAQSASGELLLFCDADDRVDDGWIAAMAEVAEAADLVGGSVKQMTGDQDDRSIYRAPPTARLPRGLGFLPFASSTCFGIWADTLQELGGWDEEFMVNEDIDICWRAQLKGFGLGFAAKAATEFRGRSELRFFLRQQFRWGWSQPLLFRRFGDHGMRQTRFRSIWKRLVFGMIPSLRSREKRLLWIGDVSMHIGRLLGSFRYRAFYP